MVSAYLAEIIYLPFWSIFSRPTFIFRPLIRHKVSSPFLRWNSFLNFLYFVISLELFLFKSTMLQVLPDMYKYLFDSNLDCLGHSNSTTDISSCMTLFNNCVVPLSHIKPWATEKVQGIFTPTALMTSHPLCVQLVLWLSKQNDGIRN